MPDYREQLTAVGELIDLVAYPKSLETTPTARPR